MFYRVHKSLLVFGTYYAATTRTFISVMGRLLKLFHQKIRFAFPLKNLICLKIVLHRAKSHRTAHRKLMPSSLG